MKRWRGWEWSGEVDWDSRPGRTLDALTKFLSRDRDFRECTLTVFCSAPLEMCLGLEVTSADICTMGDQMQLLIQESLNRADELRGLNPRIQFVLPGVFMAAGNWPLRAAETEKHGVRVLLPHPIDIVIGKLHRLEEKDVLAIDLLRDHCGRPTRDDIDKYCQENGDLFLKDKAIVDRFCSNVETLCSYLDWEPIEVREYRALAISSTQKVLNEGTLSSEILRKAIGEDEGKDHGGDGDIKRVGYTGPSSSPTQRSGYGYGE